MSFFFFHGLTGDIERDRRTNGAILSLMAGEGGIIVVMNRFNAHAAAIRRVSFLQLDGSAVSQPDQLHTSFTLDDMLANQRHNFTELDLYDAIAVDTWYSLDLYTLRKTKWRELSG